MKIKDERMYERVKKHRVSEAEKIKNEILANSECASWYNLGLAQGMAYACKVASEVNPNIDIEIMGNFVKDSYSGEQFLEFFDKLLNEYAQEKKSIKWNT